MKIKIELETTEAETFSALEKLEYFGDRIREAAALFQGKIIESMEEGFDWPPPVTEPWPAHDDDASEQGHPGDEYDHEEDEEEDEDDDDEEEDDDLIEADYEDSLDEDDARFPTTQVRSSDVRLSQPVNPDSLASANTAPIWSTLSLSAASSTFEEEEKAAATPSYLRSPLIPTTSSSPTSPTVTTTSTGHTLPQLSDEIRELSTAAFFDLIETWCENFAVEGPQPDRLEELRKIGSGRFALPILVMCYEIGSLQRLIEKALLARGLRSLENSSMTESEQAICKQERLEFADQIAANLVQVSHVVYPDLAGTYDYSTKWRR